MSTAKPKIKLRTSSATGTQEDTASKRDPMEKLAVWVSPERIWRPKTQVWYLSYAILFVLLIFVAARMQYYVAIVAIIAFMLLWFVQGSMPPWNSETIITNKGFITNQLFYKWNDILCFWFSYKEGHTILQIDFREEVQMPRMSIILEDYSDAELFEIISQFIDYGRESEVGYNIFARWIYGEYQPITKYVRDLDQPDF